MVSQLITFSAILYVASFGFLLSWLASFVQNCSVQSKQLASYMYNHITYGRDRHIFNWYRHKCLQYAWDE